MIDIENTVFNRIATALRTAYLTTYPGLKVYGEFVEYPESFPCVSLWVTDNYTYTRSQDADKQEHHANVMVTTEIYTVGDGRKDLAKKLAETVDTEMQDMYFTRTAMMVLPNVDRNAFRITLRHTAVVGQPASETDGNGNTTLTFLTYRE